MRRTQARCGALIVFVLGIVSCGEPPELDTTTADLTAAQCVYFAVNGKTTLCHATGSTNNPLVTISVSTQGCINGHSKHPHDSIAINGKCSVGACLATGAPCDATRPCCDGTSCTLGVCLAPTCVFPNQLCDDTCTSVSTDPNNCGACESVCANGTSCCEGACFDEQTDLDHCGGCSTVCADPTIPECAAAVCAAGTCGFTYQTAGAPLTAQTAGDCHVRTCDGGDGIADLIDDTDQPVDSNPCTEDVCSDGAPSNPPTAVGTSCGPAMICDGAGGCVGCVTAADCSAPASADCAAATCTAGTCGYDYQPAATVVSTQTAGDCHVQQCDGNGNIVDALDDSDLPVDGNPCTDDVCAGGVPANLPIAAETTCGPDLICDGQGACVGCLTAANCPAPASAECATAACTENTCGFDYATAGTPVASQVSGDCHALQCDGAGSIKNAVDDSDQPVDGKTCSDDVCFGGVASNPARAAETSCGAGLLCDGLGACVECLSPSHCDAPTEPLCASATCVAGTCGVDYQPAGTDIPMQSAGDCHTQECDGLGNLGNAIDDTDLPIDSNPCTDDACGDGVPSNPPVGPMVDCGMDMICDGQGACVVCMAAADCPAPAELECAAASCQLGSCGFDYQAAGTPVSAQTTGDCQIQQCDGTGSVASAIDDFDSPVDGNPCTDDACAGGVPSNSPSAAETSCGDGNVCDGHGVCVDCVITLNCPAPTNPQCAAAVCAANTCGMTSAPNGTTCSLPVPGTCSDGLCCSPPSKTVAFTNTTPLVPPNQATVGGFAPYPSPISVSGVTDAITKVTVTLHGLTHTWPADVDVLLVGPNGRSVILLSDAGGGTDTNSTVTFDDAAAGSVGTTITSGTFRPTNIGGSDPFPQAPPGPYGATLSVFNGTNAIGQWRLFALDDTAGFAGRIQNGWTLRLTTPAPSVCQ